MGYSIPDSGLYDVVDGPAGDNGAGRPNQLLAFSVPHAPLASGTGIGVLAQSLLTPLGLRSLAPGSPGYRGQHRGGRATAPTTRAPSGRG